MNECTDYENDPFKGTRRVVCAAIQNSDGEIICSARHFDSLMRYQLERRIDTDDERWPKSKVEQGFIDQWCNFLTREDALIVAKAANQIVRRCGGDTHQLFSENLY